MRENLGIISELRNPFSVKRLPLEGTSHYMTQLIFSLSCHFYFYYFFKVTGTAYTIRLVLINFVINLIVDV